MFPHVQEMLIYIIFCALIRSNPVVGSVEDELLNHKRMDPINDTVVIETWQLFSNVIDDFILAKVSTIESYYEKLKEVSKLNVSSKCDESVKFLFQEAKRGRGWAVKMLNSWPSSLPPSGVFEGTFTDFGSYHQCKDVSKIIGTKSITSQYCMIRFRPLLSTRPRFHNIHEQVPALEKFYKSDDDKAISSLATTAQYFYYTSFRVGLCLPVIVDTASKLQCDLNDVHQLAQRVGLDYALQGEVSSCNDFKIPVKLEVQQKVSLAIIFGCIFLALIGTISHLIGHDDDSFATQILSCFSLVKNTKSIFAESKQQFTCLNGIRVISICWIIFGHLMLWSNREQFARSLNILSIIDPVISVGLLNGLAAVDTFFLISGFLTCYVTMCATSGRRDQFSIFWFLTSRYMRLTPGLVLAMSIFLVNPLIGDGPLWKETFHDRVSFCHENWWLNLLYIQTYVNSERLCLLPTWYLSVDMTYHLVAAFVIVALYRSKRVGLALVAITVLTFAVFGARTNWIYGLPPTIPNMPNVEEQWSEIIVKWFWSPGYHAPAYFTGFLLGYVMYLRKTSIIKLNLTTGQMITGWTLSFIAWIAVPYASLIWHYGYTPWNQVFSALWTPFSVLFWSLAIGWIIFTCTSLSPESTSYSLANIINSILSWSAFRPLARVSYMVYLTHMLIIWSYSGSRSELTETTTITGLYIYIPHLFFSYVLGFICTILVESPFIEMQKLMFKRGSLTRAVRVLKRKRNGKDEENNEVVMVLKCEA